MTTPIVGNLQTIKLNRGTTLNLSATRLDEDGAVISTKATTALFCVKNDWSDEQALITKTLDDMTFENGAYKFGLTVEDTELLPYGRYVWDLTFTDGEDYRAKPAHGYLIIGNSAGWVANEGAN